LFSLLFIPAVHSAIFPVAMPRGIADVVVNCFGYLSSILALLSLGTWCNLNDGENMGRKLDKLQKA
jgi:hypothetical protein